MSSTEALEKEIAKTRYIFLKHSDEPLYTILFDPYTNLYFIWYVGIEAKKSRALLFDALKEQKYWLSFDEATRSAQSLVLKGTNVQGAAAWIRTHPRINLIEKDEEFPLIIPE